MTFSYSNHVTLNISSSLHIFVPYCPFSGAIICAFCNFVLLFLRQYALGLTVYRHLDLPVF